MATARKRNIAGTKSCSTWGCKQDIMKLAVSACEKNQVNHEHAYSVYAQAERASTSRAGKHKQSGQAQAERASTARASKHSQSGQAHPERASTSTAGKYSQSGQAKEELQAERCMIK